MAQPPRHIRRPQRAPVYVIPPIQPPPPMGLAGNPPALALPAGMTSLGLDDLKPVGSNPTAAQPNGRQVVLGNNTYDYHTPTPAMIQFFVVYGFVNPMMAFLCFQLVIELMSDRSCSQALIDRHAARNLDFSAREFTNNFIHLLCVSISQATHGALFTEIPKRCSTMVAMTAQYPGRAREGRLFLRLVKTYWPGVCHEGVHQFALTDQNVLSTDPYHFLGNQKTKLKNKSVFTNMGVYRGEERGGINGGLVHGVYLPNAVLLWMVSKRTHFNEILQRTPNFRLIDRAVIQAFAGVLPLYDTTQNDDPFIQE